MSRFARILDRFERVLALAEEQLGRHRRVDYGPAFFERHLAFRWDATIDNGRLVAIETPSLFELDDLVGMIDYGASPRASLGLVAAGRAIALMRGRDYVVPQDVFDIAPDVLRHRLVLSYEALAADLDVEEVLVRILSTVPAPLISPTTQDPARS